MHPPPCGTSPALPVPITCHVVPAQSPAAKKLLDAAGGFQGTFFAPSNSVRPKGIPMVAASAYILPKQRPYTPRGCTALALRQAYATAPGGSVRVSTCHPCVPLRALASRPAPLADSWPKLMLCVCGCLHRTVDMHSLVYISAGLLRPWRQPERQAAAGHPGALAVLLRLHGLELMRWEVQWNF